MTLVCDSCNQLITDYDERVYCDFKGHEYNFCSERCANDWIEEHQSEMNKYLLNEDGLFEFEEPVKAG